MSPTKRRRPEHYADALAALDAREDKVALQLDRNRVDVTHLDKLLWPPVQASELAGYTRRDYLRYLLRVAPYLLPHVRDRPLTLIRQPAGVTGRRFVHFHYEQPLPGFVDTIEIYSEKVGKAEQY